MYIVYTVYTLDTNLAAWNVKSSVYAPKACLRFIRLVCLAQNGQDKNRNQSPYYRQVDWISNLQSIIVKHWITNDTIRMLERWFANKQNVRSALFVACRIVAVDCLFVALRRIDGRVLDIGLCTSWSGVIGTIIAVRRRFIYVWI